VSWTTILALALGTYALKAAAPLLLGGRDLPVAVVRVADLLPPALLAALVAVQGLTADGGLTLDARAAGVAAALLVAWRRGSFLAIVAAAMAVTALVRLVT
jgi:branched-subunit amino acid transport protein